MGSAMTSTERFRDLTELINYHLSMHGGVGLRDIYKLIHQSVFGPEHFAEGAMEGVIAEESLTPPLETEEPLVEPISLDGTVCRVNLRTARRMGVAPSLVAEAMRESSKGFSGERSEMSRQWEETGKYLGALSGEFADKDFEKLSRLAKEKGFPPFHHSDSYRKLNRPAYRVLIREELERLMRGSPARAR